MKTSVFCLFFLFLLAVQAVQPINTTGATFVPLSFGEANMVTGCPDGVYYTSGSGPMTTLSRFSNGKNSVVAKATQLPQAWQQFPNSQLVQWLWACNGNSVFFVPGESLMGAASLIKISNGQMETLLSKGVKNRDIGVYSYSAWLRVSPLGELLAFVSADSEEKVVKLSDDGRWTTMVKTWTLENQRFPSSQAFCSTEGYTYIKLKENTSNDPLDIWRVDPIGNMKKMISPKGVTSSIQCLSGGVGVVYHDGESYRYVFLRNGNDEPILVYKNNNASLVQSAYRSVFVDSNTVYVASNSGDVAKLQNGKETVLKHANEAPLGFVNVLGVAEGKFILGVTPESGFSPTRIMAYQMTERLVVSSAVNAANNEGECVPGSICTLYGSNLAPEISAAGNVPLPAKLADTQVLVNGVAAPLYFVSPGQINFQVPPSTTSGAGALQVRTKDLQSEQTLVSFADAAPGIFQSDGVAILQTDLSFGFGPQLTGTKQNPVRLGVAQTLTMYATGLGSTSCSSQAAGVPASTEYLCRLFPQSAQVAIDGKLAQVFFAGLAPGMIGVYQINMSAPGDPPRVNTELSTVQITLGVGGKETSTNIMVLK